MKKFLVVLVAVMMCFVFASCGEDTSGTGGGGQSQLRQGEGAIPADAVIASDFDDGVTALRPQQSLCFVCGKGPLKAEFYADVEVGGEKRRVYFDKQECVAEFNSNKERYTQGMTDR